MNRPDKVEIRRALARAYTHQANGGKVLDPNLINAMPDELEALLHAPPRRDETVQEAAERGAAELRPRPGAGGRQP